MVFLSDSELTGAMGAGFIQSVEVGDIDDDPQKEVIFKGNHKRKKLLDHPPCCEYCRLINEFTWTTLPEPSLKWSGCQDQI